MPQSQTAVNPRHKEEEKMTKTNTYKTNKQMHEKHTDQLPLLPPGKVITMLKWIKKHEDKEHGKTLKNEAPRSINHKATQNTNNTRDHRLRTVSSINYRGVKNCLNCWQISSWVPMYFFIQKYIKCSVRIMAQWLAHRVQVLSTNGLAVDWSSLSHLRVDSFQPQRNLKQLLYTW